MKRFAIITAAIGALLFGLVGTASATSLSGLGAPPVNNTNCWARDGFGFVEVNCQWGTPYNYAKSLYAPWGNQIVVYGSNWPTAAAQPNGTTAYHRDWNGYFMEIDTTNIDAYNWSATYYTPWLNSGMEVCQAWAGGQGCI